MALEWVFRWRVHRQAPVEAVRVRPIASGELLMCRGSASSSSPSVLFPGISVMVVAAETVKTWRPAQTITSETNVGCSRRKLSRLHLR
jgi:hypothetical protein